MFHSVAPGFRNEVPGVKKNTVLYIPRCPQLAALECQNDPVRAMRHLAHPTTTP